MIALILSAALGQWSPQPPGMLQFDPGAQCQRTGGRCFLNRTGNRPRNDYAFFEFAPASGAGMGTACACTTPTGAKGEALTFTRAGDATCSKQGLATTGIANGDLVVCTGDQPRVESSGGVLGLRVEGARTNSVLRSSELDNAAWTDDSSPVSAITVTANQATAPDGTVTAERFQIPARTAAQWSLRRQAIAAGSTGAASIYLKGNGTSGIVSLIADGSLTTCVDCAFNSSTWTRCTLSAAGSWIFIGSASGYGACAGGARAAEDVFVWGAQTEGSGVATYATSYIPTVASAVTRNAESPSFTLGASSWGCQSASFVVSGYAASGNNQRVLGLTVGADLYDQYINFSGATLQHFTFLSAVTRQHATSNAPAAAGSANRVVYRQNGTTLVTELNGTTTTSTPAAYTPLNGAATLYLGRYSGAGYELSGIISQVQVDPTFSRCTP